MRSISRYLCSISFETADMRIAKMHRERYKFASKLANGNIILDAGCGSGYGSEYLAKSGAKYVVGLDLSLQALRCAKQCYKETANLDIVRADCSSMPFIRESFDLIVSFETIEHLLAPLKFLLECYLILKDRRTFVLSTPNKDFTSPHLNITLNPHHTREYKLNELLNILSPFFQIIEVYGQGWSTTIDSLKVELLSLLGRLVPDNSFSSKAKTLFRKKLRQYRSFVRSYGSTPEHIVVMATKSREVSK